MLKLKKIIQFDRIKIKCVNMERLYKHKLITNEIYYNKVKFDEKKETFSNSNIKICKNEDL
jgi:hypothetical protein